MLRQIFNTGIKEEFEDERKKQITISNQINFFTLLLLICYTLIEYYEHGLVHGFLLANIVVIITISLNFLFNRIHFFRLTRVLMVLVIPSVALLGELTITEDAVPKMFWVPYIPVAFSVIPYLLLSIEKEFMNKVEG
jgi:hypothetical protein